MKVSEFVIDFLVRNDIRDIFTVSGGGIAHLLDSMGRNPAVRYYCNYHEQASAISAEGYSRITGKVGACLVTIGPGAVNALAGIVGAWYDSLPILVLSGQVRSDLIADYSKIRQKGPQEGNVIEMARPVTKYVVSLRDPTRVRYELEKALHLATTGRPGPVWIEIPFDVQGATIEENALAGFQPEPAAAPTDLGSQVRNVLAEIHASRCPIVIAGNGLRLGKSGDLFLQFIERFQIPVVMHAMAKDLLPEEHPLNMGIVGTAGQRRANFAVQNADLVLVLGASLSVTKVGFNYKGFAPRARKIVVNIDPGQVTYQAIVPDVPVVADLKPFLEELLQKSSDETYRPSERWTYACKTWRERYPIILKDYFEDRDFVNIYVFMDRLSDLMTAEMPILAGNGFDVVSCYQAFKVKEGQRVIYSNNWGSMGWDLPLSVGVCFGIGRKPTVLVTGDGSFQWNIQELLTAQYYQLPLKIFIFNNGGYASIRLTQNSLFEGRLVAADASSGVGTVDFRKLADLYGFRYGRIANNDEIVEQASAMLATPGATICEVMVSPNATITPKASAFRRPDGTIESRPLEDMAPFLPREEIAENMRLATDHAEAPGPP
jgi:acetolactate synthase-1/2/3 large subunit